MKFANAQELGKAIHDNPAATSCIVNRIYSYGVGRAATKEESAWIHTDLSKDFASGGYGIKALLRAMATSDQFYRVAKPEIRAEIPTSLRLALEGEPK